VTRISYRPLHEGRFRCKANHYRIRVGGKTFLYTYIRKNGCTAFKRLIAGQSPGVSLLNRLRGIDPDQLRFIKRHKVSTGDVNPADFDDILFVYRDPLERLVSLYLNKFVERAGAEDILARYRDASGCDPDAASFEDFMAYLDRDFTALDPHCFPQVSHLGDFPYSRAIPLKALHAAVVPLFGTALADRYFRHPVNAVSAHGRAEAGYLGDVACTELAARLRRGAYLPKSAFRSADIDTFVRGKYRDDYLMIDTVESMGAAEPPSAT